MRKDVVVGLMVSKKRYREKVLKKYSHYNDLGVKLISFAPKDINWKKKKVRALIMDNGLVMELTLPFPQVVFNRCYKIRKNIIRRMASIIGKNKVFNHINHLNKWDIYRILEKTALKEYLPYTCLYEEEQFREVLRTNKLIFLKPCFGNQGRGVYRIEHCKDGLRISENSLPPMHILRLDNAQLPREIEELLENKQYIVQSGIPMTLLDEQFFDLRILVQKNGYGNWEITNMISRFAYKQYYNTSIVERVERAEVVLDTLFPPDKSKKIVQSLRNLSIQVVTKLEEEIGPMAELNVDYGIDSNGALWIIEVNGKPNKNLYKGILDDQELRTIYQRPLEYAIFRTLSSAEDI